MSQLPTVLRVNRKLGRRADLFELYEDWTTGFPLSQVRAVTHTGAEPVVTWQPFSGAAGNGADPYPLKSIAAGAFDTYIKEWAQGARAFGRPLFVRFAHEMNGGWYPWSVGTNGVTSQTYVAAWHHLVNLFRAAGADNVRWVWSPNVAEGAAPFAQDYPGAAYVDVIGLDGYNRGAVPGSSWVSPQTLFDSSLRELHSLDPSKPVMICETGSAEAGGSKAAWIRALAATLAADKQVDGFIWSEFGTTWPLQTAPSSLQAMRKVLKGPWAEPVHRSLPPR